MIGRYGRQLPLFGEEGQMRISSARVGLAGCGGLGVNVLTQLAEAGVNRYVISDGKAPDITNLNRQFIYSPCDYRPKSVVAADWVLMLNPMAEVESHAEDVSTDTRAMFAGCDVLVDCTDDPSAWKVMSDLSVEIGVPLVHADVCRFRGRVAVSVPGISPSMAEMLSGSGPEGEVPSAGAPTSAVAGLQATEVLRLISGIEDRRGILIEIDMADRSMTGTFFG